MADTPTPNADSVTIQHAGHTHTVPMTRIQELFHHSGGYTPGESWRVMKIMAEFIEGFEFLRTVGLSATIFGSARFTPDVPEYGEAVKLAAMLARDQYTIVTGGGPGIMEAANKGAHDAGGISIGMNISLPHTGGATEVRNSYLTRGMKFDYFFSRKVMMSFASEVYVFFPGGFGTLDEFFEMITLIQTHKTGPVPVVLVGTDFWQPLLAWVRSTVYEKYRAISADDMKLFTLVDTAEQAYVAIKQMRGDKYSRDTRG